MSMRNLQSQEALCWHYLPELQIKVQLYTFTYIFLDDSFMFLHLSSMHVLQLNSREAINMRTYQEWT